MTIHHHPPASKQSRREHAGRALPSDVMALVAGGAGAQPPARMTQGLALGARQAL